MDTVENFKVIGWAGIRMHGSLEVFGRQIKHDRPGQIAIAISTDNPTIRQLAAFYDENVAIIISSDASKISNEKQIEGLSSIHEFSSCGVSYVTPDRKSHPRTIAYTTERTELCPHEIRGIFCSQAPGETQKPELPKRILETKVRLGVQKYSSVVSEYSGSSNFALMSEEEIMYVLLTQLINKFNVLTFNGTAAERKIRKMFPNHFCKSIRSRSSSNNISICQIPLTRIEALKKKYKI